MFLGSSSRYATISLVIVAHLAGCAEGSNLSTLPRGAADDFKEYQGRGHYKAFAVTTTKGTGFDRGWGWSYNHLSVSAAKNDALSSCQGEAKQYAGASECRIHSLGNLHVYGMSDDELDDVINQYASDFDITNEDLKLSEAK